MKFDRVNNNNLVITPESKEERELLEEALGWNKEKSRLKSVFCQLNGYEVEDGD